MEKYRLTIAMLAMMVAALSFTACGGDDDVDNGGGNASIVGVWECTYYKLNKKVSGIHEDNSIQIGDRVCFKSDGTYYTDDETGRWSQKGNTLIIEGTVKFGDSSGINVPIEYNITKLTSTEFEFTIDLGIADAIWRFKRVS